MSDGLERKVVPDTMLQKPRFKTAYVLRRATAAAKKAQAAADEESRKFWFGIERGWLNIAATNGATEKCLDTDHTEDCRARDFNLIG
jgi:hypothetical protein